MRSDIGEMPGSAIIFPSEAMTQPIDVHRNIAIAGPSPLGNRADAAYATLSANAAAPET